MFTLVLINIKYLFKVDVMYIKQNMNVFQMVLSFSENSYQQIDYVLMTKTQIMWMHWVTLNLSQEIIKLLL